jgi:hypothetical protein
MSRVKGVSIALLAVFGVAAAQASAAAAEPPPPPKIEQVNFTNNENVLVDHTKAPNLARLKKKEEAPEAAREITSLNALEEGTATSEWQSLKGTELKKSWPVAYPKTTIMKIANTRLALEPGAQAFLKEKLEGPVTVIGETIVGAVPIKFEQKVTEVEVKLQMEKHPAYLEAVEVGNASAALPNQVTFNKITVKWKWRLKEKGGAAFEQPTGESAHNLYLIYKEVLAGAGGIKKIFFTLLAQDTEMIANKFETSAQVVEGVWKGFSKGNEPAGMPVWTYVPATGAFEKQKENMAYYEEMPLESLNKVRTAEEKAFAIEKNLTSQLLENLDGECGAWQEAFNKALKTEGIAAVNIIFVPTTGTNMLVKNWSIPNAGKEFPNKEENVKKEAGVAGQAVATPSSFFVNHQVVEVEKKLYDPSYATTPLAGKEGKEGPLGKGKEAEEIQKTYRERNISGFCKSNGVEFKCQKAGEEAGVELKFEEEAQRE